MAAPHAANDRVFGLSAVVADSDYRLEQAAASRALAFS
jgi:hypothetical protein